MMCMICLAEWLTRNSTPENHEGDADSAVPSVQEFLRGWICARKGENYNTNEHLCSEAQLKPTVLVGCWCQSADHDRTRVYAVNDEKKTAAQLPRARYVGWDKT